MNQKNLVAILGVVILILISIAIYFAIINKTSQPIAPIQKVAQHSIQQKNLARIEEMGIEIEFPDGYDVFDSEGGKVEVAFGPLTENEPGTGNGRDYLLSTTVKHSPVELIAQIKKDWAEQITLEPEIIKINDLTAVKWGMSGHCETGQIEVIGSTKNYNFSSMTCSDDFDYLERIIKTMKYIQ